jgi:hypothetical protein
MQYPVDSKATWNPGEMALPRRLKSRKLHGMAGKVAAKGSVPRPAYAAKLCMAAGANTTLIY